MSRKVSVILICIVIMISLGISIYIPNRNKIQEAEDTSINYSTVEVNGKFGIIEGEKTIIEPQYQDAKSFSMGLAAVCDDNLWGYINVDGDEIIDLQFKKALTFSSSGTVFVQDINDSWKLFKLYKYNH